MPESAIALSGRATLRQHAYLVALADDPLGQLDGFGAVALEVEAGRQAG